MSTTHTLKSCKSKHTCAKCNKKHHTLLHNDAWIKRNDEVSVAFTQNINKTVLINTALIYCYNDNGEKFVLRAMIDQGSQATIISEHASQLLKMKKHRVDASIKAIGDINAGTATQFINLKFSAKKETNPKIIQTEAIIMPKISTKMPNKFIEKRQEWSHLSKLELADPKFNIPSKIDILLGNDVWNEIVLPGLRQGKSGSPVAQKTRLGWILGGKIHQTNSENEFSCFGTYINEDSIDEQLKEFWEIEEVNAHEESKNCDENQCEQFFCKTTTRDVSGRYQVRLPFINEIPILGRSRSIAIAQLLNLERKFQRDPELKRQYVANIQEYFEENHIEPVFSSGKLA